MGVVLDLPLKLPNPRRQASASMALRRKWALYNVLWFLGTLAVVHLFLHLAEATQMESWTRYAAFFGIASLVSVAQLWRMSQFLRGRGRPLAEMLAREIKLISRAAGAGGIFLFFVLCAGPVGNNLIPNATGGATKGALGAFRSALSIYYGDVEGHYPEDPQMLTENGKYIASIPSAVLPGPGLMDYHFRSKKITIGSRPTDEGGWLYNNDPRDPNYGALWVNCTHTDTKGSVWTSY